MFIIWQRQLADCEVMLHVIESLVHQLLEFELKLSSTQLLTL